MKFDAAVKMSIKSFYEGIMPESLTKLKEDGLKYDQSWFVKFEDKIKKGSTPDEIVEEEVADDDRQATHRI